MTDFLQPPDPHFSLVVANVSGGKDSTALSLWLTEQGIQHRRVFADTGWEHPDTYRYLDSVESVLGEIDRVSPLLPMADLIRKKGMFPGRLHRYCTSELKVRPINDYMASVDPEWRAIVALGIRADESAARANALEWEHDGNDMERWTWRPLLRWTLDDVIAIHKRHGIAPNPLYLRGASRVGCWPCIHARKTEIRMVADESPERIAEIRELEAELGARRALKMQDPEYAQKATEKGFIDPTFFSTTKRVEDGVRKGNAVPIDEAVTWSRTTRGGRQFELFDTEPDKGCLRWGLCETAEP